MAKERRIQCHPLGHPLDEAGRRGDQAPHGAGGMTGLAAARKRNGDFPAGAQPAERV